MASVAVAAMLCWTPALAQQGDSSADAQAERIERALRSGSMEDALALATAAIDAGRYEQAVGILSGLLIRDPDNASLKLLLGDLYTRLGATTQAKLYLEDAMASGQLGSDEQKVARSLLAFGTTPEAAQKQKRGLDYYARLSSGIRFRTNATNGTTSDTILINDQAVNTADGAEAKSDFDVFASGYGRVAAPIAEGIGFDGRGFLFARKQFEETDNDLLALQLEPGIAFAVADMSDYAVVLRPYLVGGAATAVEELALVLGGGGLEARQRIGRDFFLDQRIEYRFVDYNTTEGRGTAGELTGDETRFSAGVTWRVSDVFSARVSYRLSDRDTRREYNDRLRHRVRASVAYDYPSFVSKSDLASTVEVGVTGIFTDYEGPNPTISPTETRDDTEWGIDVTNALALTKALTLDAGVAYSKRDSSLPNYDPDDAEVSLGVTVRF